MAVTLLGHLKESKTGSPARHLKNAIKYIRNPKKTVGGLWTGSNCGSDSDEIIRAMIETKKEFAKEWGRQGYHFVLSFPPGEADEKMAYEFGKKFCETFLGNNYDYCFAVHNDQAHMHCHIVFNSVNRISGYKYRYVEGDWEKQIQPITDQLCQEFGLSVLTYDNTKKKGKSYVERMSEKKGKIVWKDIIRADIDAAASKSYSRDDFLQELKSMGYQIRQGVSKNHGVYMAYLPPGATSARRDYNLGAGYRLEDIDRKIRAEQTADAFVALYTSPFVSIEPETEYQRYLVLRIKQATCYQIFQLDIREQARVRKDLLKITQLEEECDYLLKHPIAGVQDVRNRIEHLSQQISAEKNSMNAAENVLAAFSPEERELIQEYQQLKEKMLMPELSDRAFEDALDEMEAFENAHKEVLAYENARVNVQTSAKLDSLKYERSILRRLEKHLKEMQIIREATLKEEYNKENVPNLTD